MDVSNFTRQLAASSGIGRLMEDLGRALTGDSIPFMLGGGNPAHIPEVQETLRLIMADIVQDKSRFSRMIGNYDLPHGSRRFAQALCDLFAEECNWAVQPDNIVLTNGSQSAFFSLFNVLAGSFSDGKKRKILFPLAPEYIGYCDQGLESGLFVSARPRIEFLERPFFKYRVDPDRVREVISQHDIGALCVSRPTNPTANVLTDDEMQMLSGLAASCDIPLLVDNAYGAPFPGIVFNPCKPLWDDRTVLSMSLSKLGLPGVRTGIVLAAPALVELLSRVNAVISLAPGGIGAFMGTELIKSGRMMPLCQTVIRPFYQKKLEHALACLMSSLEGVPYHIHKAEGAFFVWVWFPDLPVAACQLYERLKSRGVLVVPGEYFFVGQETTWAHSRECLRISYAQDDSVVEQGIAIMADEVKRVWAESGA